MHSFIRKMPSPNWTLLMMACLPWTAFQELPAEMLPVSQLRGVEVDGLWGARGFLESGESELLLASRSQRRDFSFTGPFDETVRIAEEFLSGSATQESEIGLEMVRGHLTSQSHAIGVRGPPRTLFVDSHTAASAAFRLEFEIPVREWLMLNTVSDVSFFADQEPASGTTELSLIQGEETLFTFTDTGLDGPKRLQQPFDLEPGNYVLKATSRSESHGFPDHAINASSSLEFTLVTVPEPTTIALLFFGALCVVFWLPGRLVRAGRPCSFHGAVNYESK